MAKAVAQDRECPHERPAVWMKLGGGDVHFDEKGSLKGSEGKAQGEPSKDRRVDKAEGSLKV